MKMAPATPIIGDDSRLVVEERVMTYRGEDYPYVHLCYEEKETGERFTTTSLDEVNIAQVHNQYRVAHGIPFADEIRALRKHYDLPLATMSRILGFGNNQYGLYESGEMPSTSNGKLLRAVMLSPEAFGKLADDLGDEISLKARNKIHARITETKEDRQGGWLATRVFGPQRRDKYNGYAQQSLQTIRNCILFFINKMGPAFKTQMNKLLFYCDFLSYRRCGTGMTGLTYLAMQHGPVPRNWDKVYTAFDDIHPELVALSADIVGEKINSDAVCNTNYFSSEQLDILNAVYAAFGNMSSRQISERSHSEPAWRDNISTHSPIDYTYAFFLQEL